MGWENVNKTHLCKEKIVYKKEMRLTFAYLRFCIFIFFSPINVMKTQKLVYFHCFVFLFLLSFSIFSYKRMDLYLKTYLVTCMST